MHFSSLLGGNGAKLVQVQPLLSWSKSVQKIMIIDNKEAHCASDRLLCRSSVMFLYMNDHNKAKHCKYSKENRNYCVFCVCFMIMQIACDYFVTCYETTMTCLCTIWLIYTRTNLMYIGGVNRLRVRSQLWSWSAGWLWWNAHSHL